MRKWDVLFTATKISTGLELDFFEHPQTEPPPELKPMDVLNFDIVARRERFEGFVRDVRDNGDAVIEAQGVRWLISKATENDVTHPVVTKMRVHIWVVREQLS